MELKGVEGPLVSELEKEFKANFFSVFLKSSHSNSERYLLFYRTRDSCVG